MRTQKSEFRFDPFTEGVQAYVSTVTAGKVKLITQTTQDILQGVIDDGIAAGLGYSEIAKNIRDSVYGFSKFRAERIARTEACSAVNFGSLQVAKQSEEFGLSLVKVWASALQETTRESHRSANGQRRKINEPFSVGGDRLDFPGDSSHDAEAGNIVNCECTVYYERAN